MPVNLGLGFCIIGSTVLLLVATQIRGVWLTWKVFLCFTKTLVSTKIFLLLGLGGYFRILCHFLPSDLT